METRQLKVAALVAGAAIIATACAPFWSPGRSAAVSFDGELATVSWPVPTGAGIAAYEIEIDGRPPVVVAAPATACVLTGLAGGAPVTISVTARNVNNEWSGTASTGLARLDTAFTTPSGAGTGTTPTCVSTTDTDGDRLPDAIETGTGVYVDAGHTGSNPAVADTDGDGIRDGDEVLGTTGGLNLPTLGTRPTKKDILLEFDWFVDSNDCGAHSHQPKPADIAPLADGFASAPVPNPDGTTGVHVISDYGQGGVFTGGNLIADADGVIASGANGSEFLAYKASNFAPNRNGYFHWVLNPHRYNTTSTSSGQAEIGGDDLIVSLQCSGIPQYVSKTIAHELGHNLGLRHGGNVETNYKPNYNSVMNYQFQFPGVDENCDLAGDGRLDYSTGAHAPLDENNLSEAAGICGGVSRDWNANGSIDAGAVARDINNDSSLTALSDFNDWGALNFGGIGDADGARVPTVQEIVTEQPTPSVPHR